MKYVVVVRSDNTIGTLGPGTVFSSHEAAEQAVVNDMAWIADAYGCDEPETIEDCYDAVNEHVISYDWVIEPLSEK